MFSKKCLSVHGVWISAPMVMSTPGGCLRSEGGSLLSGRRGVCILPPLLLASSDSHYSGQYHHTGMHSCYIYFARIIDNFRHVHVTIDTIVLNSHRKYNLTEVTQTLCYSQSLFQKVYGSKRIVYNYLH